MEDKTDSSGAKEADDRKRVFLVDDHPILRDGVGQLINGEDDLVVCGEAGGMPAALAAVEARKPDLVLIDIFLEGGANGIELIKALHKPYPDLPMLVLSMHDPGLYAERCLRAGARGYVMKQEASRTILKAIRTVLNGGHYLSERISATMVEQVLNEPLPGQVINPYRLSDRELEIFELLGQGLSRSRIAEKLNLSVKTVETHRAHIREKLDLRDSSALAYRAMLWVEQKKATG